MTPLTTEEETSSTRLAIKDLRMGGVYKCKPNPKYLIGYYLYSNEDPTSCHFSVGEIRDEDTFIALSNPKECGNYTGYEWEEKKPSMVIKIEINKRERFIFCGINDTNFEMVEE